MRVRRRSGGRTDPGMAARVSTSDERPENEQTAPGSPHHRGRSLSPSHSPVPRRRALHHCQALLGLGDRAQSNQRPDSQTGGPEASRLTLDPRCAYARARPPGGMRLPGHARGRLQTRAGGSRRGAERDTARTVGPVTRQNACANPAVTSARSAARAWRGALRPPAADAPPAACAAARRGLTGGLPVRITDLLDQQRMRPALLPGVLRLGGLLVVPSACPSRRIPAVTNGQLRLVEDPP
jgi:hypothetical protein